LHIKGRQFFNLGVRLVARPFTARILKAQFVSADAAR
jgi:hypothetical protein